MSSTAARSKTLRAIRFGALALVCAVSACALIFPPSLSLDAPVRLSTAPKLDPLSLPATELSIIETGYRRTTEALVYRGGSWLEDHGMAFSAALIRHPRAILLVDTGLGTMVDEQLAGGSVLDNWLYRHEKGAPAAVQLGAHLPPLREIDKIILTHLHWDHASGLPDFPQAEVYVTEAEYRYAQTASRPAVVREQFDAPRRSWRFIEFDPAPYEVFERSFDLFADGSIVVVPLPGHTPGSVGVFVNLRSGKRFFFVGDVAWALDALEIPTERPWFTRLLVDSDPEQTRESIRKVYWLMKERPEIVIVPAHDLEAQRRIARFPEFEQ